LALAALPWPLRAQPGDPEPIRLTRETRAGMPAGTIKDYRKPDGFFLVADGAGIYAVTAICTHNGCRVLLEDGQRFSCPCHDSAFDLQGGVLQGPAKLALKHFQVTEAGPGGPLRVDLATTVAPHVRL
jgi:Rieske Fe-S protein